MSETNFHEIDFSKMTDEELREFRKQFNPDEMGVIKVEGVED